MPDAPAPGPATRISAVFKMPAAEVVRHFDAKRAQPSAGWETVNAAAHQTAFTVAQTAGFNVLGDIQQAIQHARDQGWSHARFRDHLEPLLRAKGWWGKAVDPATGEILKTYPGTSRPVVYGSAPRLRLIYDTSMATSYGAGRRERQMTTKDALPFLRYVAVMDGRTRPAHRALNGQVWPVDHPFWTTSYPPNGFRCRCMAQALSVDEVPAGTLNQGGEAVERFVPVNAARDMLRVRGWKTPDGRELYPDAGFDVAPGAAPALDGLAQSLQRLPDTALPAAARALASGEAFALWSGAPSGSFPVAALPQRDAIAIGQKKGSRSVRLSPDTLARQAVGASGLTLADYALVQRAISEGTRVRSGPAGLIYTLEDTALGQVVVEVLQKDDALWLLSLTRSPRAAGAGAAR